MNRRTARRLIDGPVLAASVWLAAGCEDADRASYALFPVSTSQRLRSETRFDTAWSWGSADDTILMRPRSLVAAREGGVFVYDDLSGKVTFFEEGGQPVWQWGRRGQGPNEFDHVRDMTLDDSGTLVVLDNGNSRITRLSASGVLVDQISLPEVGYADQVVPLSPDGFLIFTYGVPAVIRLSPNGDATDSFGIPWRHYEDLSAVERQGSVASEGGRWVFGFGIGDGWFAFDGTDSTGVHSYVEHTPFPLVTRESSQSIRRTQLVENRCSACTLALHADTLVVHFGGTTEDQFALLDRYAVDTGEYIDTHRLPLRATTISIGSDVVYALDMLSLFPRLVALRPHTPLPNL